jgi:hypothetical protein
MTMTTPPALMQPRPNAPLPSRTGEARKLRGSAERTATVLLTAAVIFQPILHPSGPGNSSPVDILTVASIAACAIWLAASHRKVRAPYFFPMALFIAAGLASGLVSPLPSLSLLTILVDVLLLAWCTAVVNVLSAPRALRCALAAWSWSGIMWAGVVIVAWLGHITAVEGLTAAEGNRVMFTFGDPNYASMYWVSTIFVIYAAQVPKSRWMRWIGYGMLLWALALTESNGGALAVGVGVLFLLMVRSYRRRGWVGVAAIGLVVTVAITAFFTVLPLNQIRNWAAASDQPLLVNSIGRSGQSSSERSLLIKETLQLYQQGTGVLGLGPMSTKPLLAADLYQYSNEAHDDLLAALVERGPLGVLALVLLAASALSRASPVIRRPLSAPFAAAVPLPAGLVAALLAVSVNSFYEEILHFRFVWALLGIVAVLGKDARR